MKNWVGTIQNIRRHREQLDQLPEKYVAMEHPLSKAEERAGVPKSRPTYEVAPDGSILRISPPHIDQRIVSVCDCLPGIDVDINETGTLSHLALEAVQHYARLDVLLGFFLAYQIQDFIAREKTSFHYYEAGGNSPRNNCPPGIGSGCTPARRTCCLRSAWNLGAGSASRIKRSGTRSTD